MRVLKIVLTILVAGVLVISLASCGTKSAPVSESQVATVKRGDLTVSITGSGNLALSRTADLAFEMAGTVQEVLVKEGESVTEGQVLATLDTSEWEDNLAALENQLISKQRALPQAKINLMNAETALEEALAQYVWPAEIFQARAQVYAAEADVAEAQAVLRGDKLVYDRNTGQYYYQQALTAWDIKVWTQKLSDAQAKLAAAQLTLDKLLKESTIETKIAYAQESLRAAQAALDKLLAESPVNANEIAIQKQKVELAQQALQDAQNASRQITLKKLQLEIAHGQLEDAKKAVADAQKALDEAKSASPVIKAPFAGFVTKVNVKGGDDILKGTVALQIADPNKFEVNITVSEMDISKVKLGGTAVVELEALSGLSLSANVTQISPTATIQQGVVNYQVKVQVKSLEETMKEQQQARAGISSADVTSDNTSFGRQRQPTPQITPGELPEPIKKAIEEGRLTKEQAEEMMKRMQQAQTGQIGGQQQPTPTVTLESFQLKQGMTVIVSLIIQQKSNVLLVPNTAITSQGMKSYVKVSKDGAIEEREIKTGISNSQYTEVSDGLTEGEQVIIPKTTTTTSTTRQQQVPQGGIRFFGP